MHVRKQEREGGDPEVPQLLPWAESLLHLWGELVVVVREVPHKPEATAITRCMMESLW